MVEGCEWRWLNEPAEWAATASGLQVVRDPQTDFWRGTWYGFDRHSGHVYGCGSQGSLLFRFASRGNSPPSTGRSDAAAR